MKDKSLPLSVIITTYNSIETTLKSLQSVVSQSGEFDIIVVDDASIPAFTIPDHLSRKNPVRLVRHMKNQGAAAARNTGIAEARGDWICFLDGDDVMLADTLSKRLDFAISHDKMNRENRPAAYVCGWNDLRAERQNSPVRMPNPADTLVEFCSGCWFSPGSTLIVRKRLFESKIGGFCVDLRRLEDLDWFIRFGKNNGLLQVQPLVGLDILPGNKPSFVTIERAARQIVKHHGDLKQINPKALRHLRAYIDLEVATYAVKEKKLLTAAFRFARSLARVPRFKRHLSPGWRTDFKR